MMKSITQIARPLRLLALSGAAAVLLLGFSHSAYAVAIIDEINDTVMVSDIGDMFDVNWFCATGEANSGGNCTEDISGSMWVTVGAEDADSIRLDIMLTNDSSGTANLSSWGFDVDVPIEGFIDLIITNDGNIPEWKVTVKRNLSGGIYVDACFIDVNSRNLNCNSASGTGLPNIGDNMDDFMISLVFNVVDYDGFVELSTFGAKFKGAVSGGSFQLLGDVSCTPSTTNCDLTSVPEPSTLLLFGTGLLGLGVLVRRRWMA